jgi:hypothetical protein
MKGRRHPSFPCKTLHPLILLVCGIFIGSVVRDAILNIFGIGRNSIQADKVLPSFSKLVELSGSDKFFLHHYEHYYSRWLAPYRAQRGLKLVEIGARKGKSLSLWSNYFIHPELILGVAYDHKGNTKGVQTVENYHKSIQLLFGDQSESSTMTQVCEKGPFHIILDDGSHVPTHQIFSLFSLWSCLQPGGLYIIEDTETNYWDHGNRIYGYRLKNTGIGSSPKYSAIEKLKQFIDVLHKEKINHTDLSVMPGDEHLCEVSFAKNTVALHKCTQEQMRMPPENAIYAQQLNHTRIKEWMKNARSTNPDGLS